MPHIFSLIGDAWSFYRKQPVLRDVLIWMFILPIGISNVLLLLHDRLSGPHLTLAVSLLTVILSIITLWGGICVLLVARRTVKTSAGRTRSSFAPLRIEAATLLLPTLLTAILRMCITILWSLLLIVPGILYAIRTSFASVVIATEGTTYRAALHRSAAVVRGHTALTFFSFVCLTVLLLLPIGIVQIFLTLWIHRSAWPTAVLLHLLHAVASGMVSILFLLSMVQLFGYLQKLPQRSH